MMVSAFIYRIHSTLAFLLPKSKCEVRIPFLNIELRSKPHRLQEEELIYIAGI
jgi:hypothetical protein